ncbi:MAG TPA: hypothetical protein VFE03_09410 [Caulobacteraceae bacterium]|nr:hypothetical protein [Caulobacteraceae bacterium]
MPMMQMAVASLNTQFDESHIQDTAAKAGSFAPGMSLGADFVTAPGTAVHRALQTYLAKMPPAVHETIRGVIYSALTTEPPTPVTFAWAPGYDFEVTVWQAPDTSLTRGGITVMLKSRYPDDNHPLATAS